MTNPFPSPIDGSQFLGDNSGLVSAYYMLDNDADIFKTSATGAPGTIDVGQSFWVQVGSAGTITFETDQITAGTNSFLRLGDPLQEAFAGIRVQNVEDGRFGHTFFRIHPDGTDEFEWELELSRKGSSNYANPEVYSVLENGQELLINAPHTGSGDLHLPFVVKTGSMTGLVQIGMDEESVMPQGICGYIEDTETGERVGLGEGEFMTAELEAGALYQDRFELVLMESPEFSVTSTHCQGGVVHFLGEDTDLWNIAWTNASGDLEGTGCVTDLDAGDYTFEASNTLTQCHTATDLTVEEVCMGDFNLNGERDITDLLILLVGIQPVDNFEGIFPEADCDCDGVMTTLDLLMFLPQFGAYCE